MSQHCEQLFLHIGNTTPIIALRHKLLGARAPLMTVRTHVWADLTSCKCSQLSSSASLSLTCSVDRARCLGVLWLIKNFRFCIWSQFWKNWYFSQFIRGLRTSLPQLMGSCCWWSSLPGADEKLRRCNYPLLHGQQCTSPRPPWTRFSISKCNKPARDQSGARVAERCQGSTEGGARWKDLNTVCYKILILAW